MRITIPVLLLIFLFISGNTFTQETPEKDYDKKGVRPKVGLVLSGGGAKGFAYIGLFKVLQEVGLKIDYIGGTSIGSIMAAMYAVGYSPEEIEKIIRTQNWAMILRDEIPRKYISYEEKEFLEGSIISFPYTRRKIALKKSLFIGQQVNQLLNRYLTVAYDVNDFSKLKTPFICMGTDLLTGEAVTLNSGYLPLAVRSSMSIPGYFSPCYFQGKYLVDGGVVDNYPAKQVQDMGAQLLIGGNLQSGLADTITKLNTITATLDQIISFSRIDANKLADSLIDYKIQYNVEQGIMDFVKYDSIIAYGERVARQHYNELKKLADSLNAIEYIAVDDLNTQPLEEINISDIEYQGNKKMSRIFLDNYFKKFSHSTASLDEIEITVDKVYGTKFFDHIYYELEDAGNDSARLIINIEEAAPGYISASLHYDNDYHGSIMLSAVFRNTLGNRSKLFASLILGPNPRFKALYLISNGPKPGPGIELDFYSFKFDLYEKDRKINTIRFINYKATAFLSSVLKNLYSFRAGVEYEYFGLKPDIYDAELDPLSDFNSYINGFVSFRADTRDKPYFSTSGFKSELKALYIMPLGSDWSGQLFTYSLMYYLHYDHSVPLSKKLTIKPGVFIGGTLKQETPPIQHWYGVGGLVPINYINSFVSFTGVDFIQSFGLYAAIARLKLQYNPFNNVYFTLRSDAGANQIYFDDLFKSENFMIGYGITGGYNSLIGPIELTLMGSNIASGAGFFVSLGFDF